jgi:hypothetical protein
MEFTHGIIHVLECLASVTRITWTFKLIELTNDSTPLLQVPTPYNIFHTTYYYYYYYYYYYDFTALCYVLVASFQALNLYTIGRTPWTGDQLVARPPPTYRTAQT